MGYIDWCLCDFLANALYWNGRCTQEDIIVSKHLMLSSILTERINSSQLRLIIVFFAQILFVVNFFYSIWYGKKMTTKNPWGATTLEWTTPINTGHGNWPGKLPVVHRWSYDYSKDPNAEKDFIAQHIPLTEEEKHSQH